MKRILPVLLPVCAALFACRASSGGDGDAEALFGSWIVDGLPDGGTLLEDASEKPNLALAPLAGDGGDDSPDLASIAGRAGCNRFGGEVTVQADGSFACGPLVTTKMVCPPPIMAVEQAVLSALSSATTWKVQDGSLRLSGPTGELVLVPAAE